MVVYQAHPDSGLLSLSCLSLTRGREGIAEGKEVCVQLLFGSMHCVAGEKAMRDKRGKREHCSVKFVNQKESVVVLFVFYKDYFLMLYMCERMDG